jgi:hypothetical protein
MRQGDAGTRDTREDGTMNNGTRADDFGVMECGDGLTITKGTKGTWYIVRRDGEYSGNFPTLWEAMQYVEAIRHNNK